MIACQRLGHAVGIRILTLIVGLIAACNGKPGWKLEDRLDVHARATREGYDTVADLASVRPGLEVIGATKLREPILAKLTADHVGHDGHVRVEVGTPSPTDSKGVLDISVQVTAMWGTAAGRSELHAALTGGIHYSATGDVGDSMTRAIGEKLALQIEKLFPGAEPAHVVAPVAPAPATAVSVGLHMSCSLHRDGTVRCWGGDAPRLAAVPVAIAGIANATQIAVGDELGCALLADGTAACWNPASWSASDDELAAHAVCGVDHLRAVTAGCGLGDDGSVRCWSAADLGDCAQKTTTADVAVIPNVVATQLATSFWRTCALDATHQVSCWDTCKHDCAGTKPSPSKLAALTGTTQLAVGGVACGVIGNRVRCVLGGDPKPRDYAIADAVDLAVGLGTGVARTKAGTLVAWDDAGEVAPTGGVEHVVGVGRSSRDTTCALTATGEVWCAKASKPFARVVYATP